MLFPRTLQLLQHPSPVEKGSQALKCPSQPQLPKKSIASSLVSFLFQKILNYSSKTESLGRLHSIDSDELSSSPSAFAPVTEHLPKGSFLTNHRKPRETSKEPGDETTDLIDGLHFRPINAAPLTPPKNSPGSKI